jgi:hypothetical protein
MSAPPASLTTVLPVFTTLNSIMANSTTMQKLQAAGIRDAALNTFQQNMGNVLGPIGGLLQANGLGPKGPPPPYNGTNNVADISTNLSSLKTALNAVESDKTIKSPGPGFPTMTTIKGNIDKVTAALPNVTALTTVLPLFMTLNSIMNNFTTMQKLQAAGITGGALNTFQQNMGNVIGPIGGLLSTNGLGPSGPPPPYNGTNNLADLSINLSSLKTALNAVESDKTIKSPGPGFPTMTTIKGNIDKVTAALPSATAAQGQLTASAAAAQQRLTASAAAAAAADAAKTASAAGMQTQASSALSSVSSTIQQAITSLQSGGGMGVATIQKTLDNLSSVPKAQLSSKAVTALNTATTVLGDLKRIEQQMADSLIKASSLIDTAKGSAAKGGKRKNKRTRRQKKGSRRNKRQSRR